MFSYPCLGWVELWLGEVAASAGPFAFLVMLLCPDIRPKAQTFSERCYRHHDPTAQSYGLKISALGGFVGGITSKPEKSFPASTTEIVGFDRASSNVMVHLSFTTIIHTKPI